MIRRYAAALAVIALVALAPAGAASATASRTCHHGASHKPCRPDPQPTHGRDCTHPSPGNPAGINQDHCSPTTTTTSEVTTSSTTPSTTVTTTSPTTTTTTGGSRGGGTSTTTSSPSASPGFVNPPGGTLGCMTPVDSAGRSFPFTTNPELGGCPPALGSSSAPPSALSASRVHSLARTGAATRALVWFAFLLLALGLALRWAARKP